MGTLKEEATQYEPPTTKNIADLDIVDTSLPTEDREATDKEGKVFTYKVIVVDGVDYRVPNSVLGNLKDILKKNPNITKFSVARSGDGLNTRYTVVPIM